jgi:hypothetical protein
VKEIASRRKFFLQRKNKLKVTEILAIYYYGLMIANGCQYGCHYRCHYGQYGCVIYVYVP